MPLQKKKDKYENPSLVTRKEEKPSNTIQATAEQALRFRDAQRDTKKELVDSYQDQKRVQDLKKQQVREEKSSVMTGIRKSYEKYMREQGKIPYEDPGIDRMTQDRFGTLGYLNTGMIHSDPLYAAAIQAGGGSFKVADVEREKYASMSSNADFNEYSTYVPTGVKRNPSTTMQMADVILGGKTASKDMDYDLLYDALNGDADAEKLWNSGIKKADYENAKYLTDDERKVFNYLYKKEGAESVDRYMGYMEPLLNERARKQNEADVSSFAAENPIAASALSVVASPFKIASTIGQVADYAIDGEVDQNANYNMFSYLPNAIRNQVSEDIAGAVDDGSGSEANKFAQDAATFGYQTTLSILDNVLNMAIGTAFAAGGNPDTVRKAAGAASQIIMSSSAAADTMIDARDKGRSSDESLTVATVAGIAEWLTEKWSVEALLNDDIIRDNAVKYVAKNMLAEGSEEVASDLINTVADIIVLKDDSEWQRSIAEIKAEHPDWSNKKAFAYAVGQKALEVGVSFLGGAISGGILSGANVGRNIYYQTRLGSSVNNAKNSNDLLYSVAEEAIDNAKVMEDTASGKKETSAANAETKRADEFLQKVVDADDSNSKLSNREVGRQIQINDDNMVNTIATKAYETNAVVGEAVNEAVNNSGNVSEETVLKVLDNDGAVQAISKATGKNLDGISLKEQIETVRDYIREGTRDYVNERIVNLKSDTMGELGSRVLRNNYQTSGIEDVQKYVENVDALYSYGAQLDRNVNVMTNEVVDAAIQSTGATINRDVAHRAIIAGFNDIGNGNIELTGGSNGETNGDSGSGRIYRLAERKGPESTSGKRSKAAAGTSSRQERLRHVKDVVNAQIRTRNGQRVSSSELGFTDGTDEKRNVVLDDQAIEELGYTERVKGLERRTGAKVMLVTGTMEQAVQHTDGKTEIINVRGSFDPATNTLIVQADNRNLDFEQIGLHEEFHSKFKNTNAAEHDRMIDEIRDKIAGHDDAEFMALIEMYKDKYGWKNMGYSEEYIVEEILADAYAGIDVWDYLTPMLGATRYTDAVRKYAEAIVPSEMYGDDGFAKYSTADEFEMAAPLEETDRLIAIHNMHESALQSMIDLGGLAMPSFAVKPAHIGHTTYGIISVVAGKNSIDPTRDRDAVIYGGDAWTPTFPEVHIKPSNKALKAISKRMDKVFADEKLYKYGGLGTNTYHIALDEDNARDAFERWGSFEEAYGRNNMMKLMFLKETGRGVPIPQMEKKYKNGYDSKVFNKVNELIDVNKRYDYTVNELTDEYGREVNDILREFYLEKYDGKKFGFIIADQMAPNGGVADYNDIIDLLDVTARYNYDRSVGNNTQLDTSTLDESIDKLFAESGIQEEYDEWLKELGKGTIEKKGIRNDKDMFTPSGNRRTFEQLHYDFTLDNIVKAMRSEAKQGRVQFMSGPASVKGAALKSYKNIEEVRAERNRILDALGEEGNSAYDEFHDATLEIAKKINSNDWLSGADDLADILGHAKTASRILNYMRKEFSYLHPTMDLAEEIENLGKMANSLPIEYFEAKLYRAFPVSEALAYVVPDNLDENLKKNLKAAGGKVIEYKAEDMDDRLKKINGIEGARFSTEDYLQDSAGEYNDNTLIGGDEYAERLRDGRVLWFEESNTKRSSTAAYRAAAQVIRRNLESRRFSEVSGKGANSTDSEGGLISKEDAQKLIGSVLVNRDGKPVPLYHVSTIRFDHHKYGDVGFHYGYDYQARRLAELNEYSSPVYRRAYVNIQNPAVIMTDPDIWTVSETLRLLRDYNYITKDEYKTIVMISSAEEENISTKEDEKQIYNTDAAKELRALLRDKGIDGIIYANGNEGKGFSVIAFDDDQIVTTDKEYISVPTQRNSTEDSDGNALTAEQQEDDYIRYSREMDKQARVNFGSMFSGTGTVDFALRNMINHRFAVEYDRQIAGVFKSNNGDEIFIGDVRDAVKQGYLDDKDVEYFHASPVCKNFSSQKHDSGEQPIDISTAQAVADAIDSLGPKIFTLENVKGYRNSRAVNLVKDALTRNGYVFDEHVYRASDYGGSTIRERYFIRAVKDVSEMPPMPEKVQGMSWYDTVSDLIPELPEWPMKAGGYMETRWNAIKDQVDTSRPVLILRGTKGGSLVYAEADEFSPTIIASDSEARIFMPDGRVLRATPRVLARIQGLPDSFKLPTQTSLANKVIGNGIPVQLTQAVAGSLLGQVDGVNDIRFSREDEEFVRYSRETDPETLEFLNNQELVPVYRAMQLIDGKLYPPMAAVVNGSLVEPAEPGVWYKADEHPELIKLNDKGKPQFNLNKGNGKGLAAAYNPYWHTSSTPLNDQFTSAYDRPNLVVVKGYVPKSELTSGYRAKYAKDPVGIAKWHAGTVDGKLRKIGKGRQVILSRYFILDDNPVVSEKDAAAFIREQIGDSGITVPWNVVTPSLRRALEAEGVTIDRKSAGKTSRTYEEQIEYEKSQRFSTEDAGYHAGDLGKAESYSQQGYYRGTGHFGTGTYFVGDESLIEKYNMRNGVKAPHEKVDFSKYNLYRPGERLGLKLHEALKVLDGGIDSKHLDAAIRGEFQYREPAYKAFYDRLDKYRDEGLEWEDAKIAAYQDELNGIDPEEIEYEFKTYDEFFKNYSKGWKDIDEDDYEFYKVEYVDYLKAISDEYNEKDSAMYDRLRDAVFNLQMMFGFNKETEKALRDTLAYQEEMQNASYEKQKVSDSLATVFMKSLGYEGIDVRGTNLDNVSYGSVIYDLKGKDLERKKAIGTARYSTESMSDAEQNIREENEYLKGAYASLLTEVRTNKRSASKMRTNANKTADRIREEYESRISKADLRDRMNRLVQDYIIGGEQNESVAYQNAKNEAVDIARDIVNNAGRMKNADEYDRYLDLKKRVKNNDGIYLDPSLRGDQEKYQEIRKRLFGKVNLKNSGTPLDTFYQGLVNDFGELFDPDVAPGIDQLNRIEEVLNTLAPIYENPYNGRIAEAIELCANDILMSLTDGTIVPDSSSQNARQQAKVEAARQSGIDYARKAIAAERVYEKKRIDNALAYYKNRDKKRIESAERERLRRIANRLNNRKLPAATRALVEQYIGELDLISVKLTNKRLENLKDLRLWYDDQQTNNPDFVKDPEIEKLLQRLSTRQISELNIEEVRWLTTCLQNIENELATAKKTIDTEDQRDIHIQAEESMADIDHSKGNGNNSFTQGIDSFFVNGTLSPIRAMKRIVGYNTESPIYLRTLELEQGQIKSFDWQRKAEANFLRWTNDSKFMESIVGKKAKMIDIGNGIQITPAMRMSLYLHSKNEQNMRHIIYGGVTVPNIKEYKSGNMSKAYGKGSQTIKLNAKQVNDIIAGMTDEEKAFANAAAKYFNGTSQESINEVSEKLKGYSLALVQNYFPINTNTNFTLADYETVKMDGTIEGMGFLKERQNASNPIYLRDMTDVLEKSITSTAKYVGLAIPVRNFNKLYNVSSSEFGDDAKAALEEMKNAKSLKDRYAARERMRNARELFTGSMRESVMQKWDIEGINYIEKMMADIQNPRGSRSAWAKMFGNIRSNYAGSVLSLSASVAMKQAASYPTAAAVLGWKPLGQAFTDVFKLGKRFDMDLVNKYTPLLWHRASNFNVQYLGNVGTSVNQNRLQKLLSSKPLNWITDMDIATTRLLWYASEHYVQDNNKALVNGSDAYYKAVAEIYNRVITETQPNYTTMERPELLRTDDTLLSSMMMFKTQSFQNFNVLYDAIGNYNAKKNAVKVLNSDENKAALADAKKGILMASTSQLVQTFVFAAMTAVCAALMGRKDKYKDDEGEVTLESLSKQVGKDMISSAMSMVPFGGEIYNVLARVILGEKYYGFDNITASSLDDLFNAFIKASDSIKDGVNAITNKDGAELDWNDQRINMDGILNAFTKAFGIPYDNASKIFEAIVQHVSSGFQGKYEGTYTYLRLTKKMSDTGAYYDNLFKAYENDKESYESLKKKMIEDGFDEEKIRNAMNSRLKTKAGVANVSDLDHKLVDPKYQDEYDEAINMLLASTEYKKLSDEDQKSRRSAVESTLKDSDKMGEIEKAGLDIGTYSLYLTARKLADVQGDNNGSYTKEEKEAAVKMLLNSGEITSSDAAAIRKYGK